MADDKVMVYEGQERTFTQNQSPLQIFKGPEAKIEELGIQDGCLYFATDSKKIYLDCDFTDSLGTTLKDRIPFGGSTGIWYATKVFTEAEIDIAQFTFTQDDFDNISEVPMVDDLILNEGDGSFYRITAVTDYSTQFQKEFDIDADRLTVSGSGGGGGGGGGGGTTGAVVKIVGGRTKYWAREATSMPITFTMTLEDAEETIGYRLYIGKGSTVVRAQVSGLPQSNEAQPTTINIADFKDFIDPNVPTEISIMPFGDDGTEVTRSLKWSVTLFNISIAPYTDVIGARVGEFDNYTVIPTFGTELQNVILNWKITDNRGNEIAFGQRELAAVNTGRQVSLNVGEQTPGTYHIITWLQADIPGSSGQRIISSELDQICSWVSSAQDVPVLSVTFPPTTQQFQQYDVITVPYTVYYREATISVTEYVIYTNTSGETTTTEIDSKVISTGVAADPLTYSFQNTGTYRFRIMVGDNATSDTSSEYVIEGVSGDVPTLQRDGLALYMNPTKTNNSATRDVWENEGSATYVKNGETIPVDVTFENINWVSNGWGRDDEGVTMFHLDNGAKLTVNGYSPFAGDGAQKTGRTIELDIKISNIKDRSKRLFTCVSENSDSHTINTGIVANGDFIALNGSAHSPTHTWESGDGAIDDVSGKRVKQLADNETGLVAWYCEGERVHVTFVITLEGTGVIGTMPKGFVYTYINGVISGLVPQSSGETFKDGASISLASRFIFDSTYADIDIYGIRVYETALDDQSVLINYLATYGNTLDAIDLYRDNQLLDPTTGRVSLAKVKAYGKIPYLVLRGGRQCDKSLTKFEGYGSEKEVDLPSGQNADSDGHDNGKKDFRFMEGYLVNPLTGYNIGSEDNHVLLTVYAQGTSSLQYPVKNLRIKFWNKDTSVNNYTPKYGDDGKAKKSKVKVYANQPADASVYTLKADYMDSSSAHNTGTGNALPELYGTHKTLAQRINDKTLTAINGYPIVIFWKKYRHTTNIQTEDIQTIRSDVDIRGNGIRPIEEAADKDSDYEYIGRYNFDLDKSEAKLYGFYTDYDNHYGVRLDTNNVYDDIANASDVLTGLRSIPIQHESFRALIDDDDDLTYDPAQVYYTKPYKTAATWTQPTIDNNGAQIAQKALNTGLEDRLAIGPLYVLEDETKGANSIECWEFSTNNVSEHPLQLQFFQDPWNEEDDPTYGNWTEAFESRYPEYVSQESTDKRSFARLINWVASTNAVRVGHEPTAEQLAAWANDPSLVPDNLKPLIPDPMERRLPKIQLGEFQGVTGVLYQDTPIVDSWNDIPYADAARGVRNTAQYTSETTFYYDSFEYRLHKFKSEFDQYLNRDFTLIYYIITEFLIGKDSRAKNMMMACFDANPEMNVGHWFPIFYDVDTILGLDNVGKLRYRYDEEDYDYGIFNTNADYFDSDGQTIAANYSVLWSNVRRTMYNEIKTMYREMRSARFNYQNLIDIYNTRLADAWNATLINQDVWYKFVRFLTGYIPDKGFDDYPISTPNPSIMYAATDGTTASAWLPAVQGTRSLHREQIIRRRLAYLDGKYGFTDGGVTIAFRAQAGQEGADEGYTPLGIWDLTVHDSCYLSINASAERTVGPFRFTEGSRKIINSGTFSGTEQEMNFHFFNQVSDSHDLSGQRIGTLTFNEKPGYPHRLTNLDLTHSRVGYEQTFRGQNVQHLTQLNLSSLPYLQTLNVSYLTSLVSVSLADNPYITEVYAKGIGSSTSAITFPDGGILRRVELPKSLTKLDLKGHNLLSTLVVEDNDYSKIKTLYIEDCKLINTKNLFDNISRYGSVEQLEIKLPDINWTIDYNEVVLDNDSMVQNIPILDKLILASGPSSSSKNEDNELIEGRTYVAGTITILNNESGHEFGLDENEIYEKYGKYYPGIKIVFTHNSLSTIAYTFNAWTASGGLIQQKKLKSSVVENITFEELFNDTLPAQTRDSSPKYDYTFIGWNLTGNLLIEEDDDDHHYTLSDARDIAESKVVARYNHDQNTYMPGTVIEFGSNLFDETTREMNIYPTFLGTVRSFEVTFYNSDDIDTAEVYEVQTVRYGAAAIAPAVAPVKVVFNENDVNDTRIYTLAGYSRSFANITTDNIKIYPRFNTTYTDAKTYIAPPEAFEILDANYSEAINPSAARFNTEGNINGVAVKISYSYNNEFITIPKALTVNGYNRPIVSLQNESTNLRRVYFEEGNNIRIIENGAFSYSEKLEFIDLAACTNLYRIGSAENATWITGGPFANCPKLKVTALPDSLAIIGQHCFRNTGVGSQVMISKLPEHLQLLGSYAFAGCTEIGLLQMSDFLHDIPGFCFNGCSNLQLPNTYYFQGVYTIGTRAFENCSSLNTFNAKQEDGTYLLSGTLQSIGTQAFKGCSNLGLEALPVWTLKELGTECFRDCGYIKLSTEMAQPSLTNVDTDKVKWGKNVFAGCTLYRRLMDQSGAYVGIESLMPRLVLRYGSGKYDIDREVFGENITDGLQFAYYDFGQPIDTHDGQYVYNENAQAVEGGLNLFVAASNWGSFGSQFTQNRRDIAWLSDPNNPWCNVLDKLFETGQLRIWYTKNGNEYIYHSNLNIYMTNN